MLADGIKVYYYKEANVLDEKVHKSAVFENQRKRWISSQYHYLAKYFSKGVAELMAGNFTYFNSAVLRNIQLPRLINLGLLGLLTALLFFFNIRNQVGNGLLHHTGAFDHLRQKHFSLAK